MRYKHYENANIDVSELAIGTWGLDDQRWIHNTDISEAIQAIRLMVEKGVNLIDTAPNYGNGTSEKIVAEAIKTMDRSQILISTKFGTQNDLFTKGVYRDARFGTIMRDLAGSLRNLQTDYVDFYFMHWPDVHTPIAETMCALNFLKQEGKIRFIGLSNCDLPLLKEALKYGQVDVIQPPFSMIDQRYKELMEWCHIHHIDVMTYGSLGGGILSGHYRTLPNWPKQDIRYTFYKGFQEPYFSKIMELMKTLDQIASNHHATTNQVVINWTCQKEYVSTALVGVRTLKHVNDNINAFDFKLTDEEIQSIDFELERLELNK